MIQRTKDPQEIFPTLGLFMWDREMQHAKNAMPKILKRYLFYCTVHPLKEFERCRRSGQQTLRHPIFANCTVGTVPPTMWATFWIPKENLGQTVLLLLPCKIHTVSLFIWALAFMATSVSGRGDFEGAAFLRPPHDRQGRGIVEPCWG